MKKEPIVIQDQGSFFVGGSIVKGEGTFDPMNPPDCFNPPNPFIPGHPEPPKSGQTLRGDHVYVSYQMPVEPKKYPLVLLHGGFQSAKCWETTPDGREGYTNIFLRRGYTVYTVDQPRRGRAGRTCEAGFIPVNLEDETTFNCFRLGLWPNLYENTAFPKGEEALNQFLRQVTPNTAFCDGDVVADGMAAVFDKIGEGILVTHSQSGGFGWKIALRSDKLKAIVAYEPGSGFIFPEGEEPGVMPTCIEWDNLAPFTTSKEDFMKFTKVPIVIYYGDNIPDEPCNDWGMDHWRVRRDMAKLWVDKVNEYGGHAELIDLPKLGITGNTHFPFSDVNNLQVADEMSRCLAEQGLDK